MASYNIHEAKSQLSKLIQAMEQGETVIIAKAGKPVAQLGPLPTPDKRRIRGILKGQIRLGPKFDEALPVEIAEAFEGRG